MKRIILTVLASLFLCSPSFGWGREGHEAIAKIAEILKHYYTNYTIRKVACQEKMMKLGCNFIIEY